MLNILPPAKKIAIEQHQLSRFVQRCCFIFVGCGLLFSSVMLVSRLVAQFMLTNVQSRETVLVKTPDQTTTLNQLHDITTLSSDVAAIQKNFHQPLPVLLQLLNHIPPGIVLSSVEINYSTTILRVTGQAATRDQLLTLSQIINEQPDWSSVKFPLQDFTQKNNIPFEFQMTITSPL